MDTPSIRFLQRLTPPAGLRAAAVLFVVLLVSACGSSAVDNTGSPTEPTASGEPNDLPSATLDQTLSFARPVDPFANEILAVLVDGNVDIIDTSTGERVASHPTELEPGFAKATHRDGAVYITDKRAPGLRQLTRIDAAGVEVVEFEATGWIDHRPEAPEPTLVTRSDETASLMRLRADGQIDQHHFDSGVFIKLVDDTTLVSDAEHNGNLWLLDNDLTVTDSAAFGTFDNVPVLLTDNTVRVSQNGERYIIDLTTWEATADVRTGTPTNSTIASTFGDGWTAALTDDVMTITNPDGEVTVEEAVGAITNIRAVAHPSNNTALVALRTCTSREGDLCNSARNDNSNDNSEVTDGSNGISDEAGDEPYVPPGFIEVHHLDLQTATLTKLDIGAATSIATLALDSGWFAASVDGSTTNVITISADGESQIIEEIPSPGHDFTTGYIEPAGTTGLALLDYGQASKLVWLTDGGVQQVSGFTLNNNDSWRAFADRFEHLA